MFELKKVLQSVRKTCVGLASVVLSWLFLDDSLLFHHLYTTIRPLQQCSLPMLYSITTLCSPFCINQRHGQRTYQIQVATASTAMRLDCCGCVAGYLATNGEYALTLAVHGSISTGLFVLRFAEVEATLSCSRVHCSLIESFHSCCGGSSCLECPGYPAA